MAARALLPLLLALAACQGALGGEDVVTITGGQKELEALVQKHPFVVIEARSSCRRRWMRRCACSVPPPLPPLGRVGGQVGRLPASLASRSPTRPVRPALPPTAAVLRALVRPLQAAGA